MIFNRPLSTVLDIFASLEENEVYPIDRMNLTEQQDGIILFFDQRYKSKFSLIDAILQEHNLKISCCRSDKITNDMILTIKEDLSTED